MMSWITLALTLIVAMAVVKNGHPKIIGVLKLGLTSRTTKSTRTKRSLIFTRISSAIPAGYRTDWSANCKTIEEDPLDELQKFFLEDERSLFGFGN